MLKLRDLEYVVALADLRSFIAAAEQCSVSQPTLSAQLKKLEEQLGVSLFERSNKHVLPTEVGGHIVQSARRILHETERIKDAATSAQDPLAGRFRLGAFPTLASYVFPDLVPRVRENMPNLRLVLVEEKSEILLEKLRQGTLDAAFLALPVNDNYLYSEHLFDDPFFVAVNSANALADLPCMGAAVLRQHKLLLLEEGHCLRDQALEVCEQLGTSDDADLRATSLETLRQMVRADTGITLMPEIAIDSDDPHIRFIPFEGAPPFRSIGLVRRKTSSREKVFEQICELAR